MWHKSKQRTDYAKFSLRSVDGRNDGLAGVAPRPLTDITQYRFLTLTHGKNF